jgi:predicted XRE-type DNA-binding protein
MTARSKIPVQPSSGNVFEDLGFDDAEELQVEAALTLEICNILSRRKLSQRAAAKLLGIAHTDVHKLVHGRYTGFSMRRLIALLNRLDRDVEIVIRRKPKSRAESRIQVRAA